MLQCKYIIYILSKVREGQYALDIGGRKSGYRLVIIPLDDRGKQWEERNRNIYKATKVIIAWEVSNHYE